MRKAYGSDRIREEYHCNYGLNPALASRLWDDGALRPVAHDGTGAVRAVELTNHPFFVATLFQPERRALKGELPPIVFSFVSAARS